MLLLSDSEFVAFNFVYLISGIAIGLVCALLFGYLFNYFMIKELRKLNDNIEDLADTIGYGLKKLEQKPQPQQQYRMKTTDTMYHNDNGYPPNNAYPQGNMYPSGNMYPQGNVNQQNNSNTPGY